MAFTMNVGWQYFLITRDVCVKKLSQASYIYRHASLAISRLIPIAKIRTIFSRSITGINRDYYN